MKKLIYSMLAFLATSAMATQIVSASTNTGDMMRYYNVNKGTYLFTVNANEIQKIKGLSYLQPQGAVFTTADSGTKLYRFYHKKTGRYVFTGKQDEIAKMKKNGWVYEGFAFYSGGNVPIYRLYQRTTGQHFYTGNVNEVSAFVRKGWVNEGIGFYATSSVKRDIYEMLTYEKTEDSMTMRMIVTVKNGILQSSQEQTTSRFPQALTEYQFALLKPHLQQQIEQNFNLQAFRRVDGITVSTNVTKELFQVKIVYDYTKISVSKWKAAGIGYVDAFDRVVENDRVYIPVELIEIGATESGWKKVSK